MGGALNPGKILVSDEDSPAAETDTALITDSDGASTGSAVASGEETMAIEPEENVPAETAGDALQTAPAQSNDPATDNNSNDNNSNISDEALTVVNAADVEAEETAAPAPEKPKKGSPRLGALGPTPPPVADDFIVYDGKNAANVTVDDVIPSDTVLHQKNFVVNVTFPENATNRKLEIQTLPGVVIIEAPGFTSGSFGGTYNALPVKSISDFSLSKINGILGEEVAGGGFARDSQTSINGFTVYNGTLSYTFKDTTSATLPLKISIQREMLMRGTSITSFSEIFANVTTSYAELDEPGTSIIKDDAVLTVNFQSNRPLDSNSNQNGSSNYEIPPYTTGNETFSNGLILSSNSVFHHQETYYEIPSIVTLTNVVWEKPDKHETSLTEWDGNGVVPDNYYQIVSEGGKDYLKLVFSEGYGADFGVLVDGDVTYTAANEGIAYQFTPSNTLSSVQGYFAPSSETSTKLGSPIKITILNNDIQALAAPKATFQRQINSVYDMDYSFIGHIGTFKSDKTGYTAPQSIRLTFKNPDNFQVRTFDRSTYNTGNINDINIVLRNADGEERLVTLPTTESINLISTVFDDGIKATADEYIVSMTFNTNRLQPEESLLWGFYGRIPEIALDQTKDFVNVETIAQSVGFESGGTAIKSAMTTFKFLKQGTLAPVTNNMNYNPNYIIAQHGVYVMPVGQSAGNASAATVYANNTIRIKQGVSCMGNISSGTVNSFKGVIFYVETLPGGTIDPDSFTLVDETHFSHTDMVRGGEIKPNSITTETSLAGNTIYRLEFPDIIVGDGAETGHIVKGIYGIYYDEFLSAKSPGATYNLKDYMGLAPMAQAAPDMAPLISTRYPDTRELAKTFGDEFSYLIKQEIGLNLTVKGYDDIMVELGMNIGDRSWARYDYETGNGMQTINADDDTGSYVIHMENLSTADATSLFALVPIPKTGESIPSNETATTMEAYNPKDYLQAKPFTWSSILSGQPTTSSGTTGKYMYSLSYTLDINNAAWLEWDDVKDNLDRVKMVKVEMDGGLAAGTEALVTIPITMLDVDDEDMADQTNIFGARVYRALDGIASGYVRSQPFGGKLFTATVQGDVFIDKNANGTKDAGETDMVSGILVKLFKTGTSTPVGETDGYLTDEDGHFTASDLDNTNVDVKFYIPEPLGSGKYRFTAPTPATPSAQEVQWTSVVTPGQAGSHDLLVGIKRPYTVTFHEGGGMFGSIVAPGNAVERYYGEAVSAATAKDFSDDLTPPAHYNAFDHWALGSAGGTSEDFSAYTVSGDTDFYADYTPDEYAIRFYGGSEDALADTADPVIGTMVNQTAPYNKDLTLDKNEFTRHGYTFIGWDTTSAAITAVYADEESDAAEFSPWKPELTGGETLDLYAVWAPRLVTYIIRHIDVDQTGTDVASPQTINPLTYHGDVVTGHYIKGSASQIDPSALYAPVTQSGTHLSDEQAANGVVKTLDYGIDGAANIITLYYKRSFTVTFDADGGKIGEDTVRTVVEERNNLISPKAGNALAPVRKGYVFIGWKLQGTGDMVDFTQAGYAGYPVTGDQTLLAQWKAADVNYTVHYYIKDTTTKLMGDKSGGGSYGESVTEKAADIDHYVLSGDSSRTLTLSDNAASNVIVFEYILKSYTVTFVDHDGKVLNTQSVKHGADAIKPGSPARSGYVFRGWDKEYTNITSDLTVTAQYTKEKVVKPPVEPPVTPPVTPPVAPPVVTPPVTPAAVITPPAVEPPAETSPAAAVLPTPSVVVPSQEDAADPIEPSPEPEATAGQSAVAKAAAAAGIPILPGGVPLITPAGFDTWSLMDLILAIAGVVLIALTLISSAWRARRRRDEDGDYGRYEEEGQMREGKTRTGWLILAAVLSVLGVALFLFTQDMRLPMVLLDIWTIVFAVLFAAEIVFARLTGKKEKREEEARPETV